MEAQELKRQLLAGECYGAAGSFVEPEVPDPVNQCHH